MSARLSPPDSIRLNMEDLILTGRLVDEPTFLAGSGMSLEALQLALRERRMFRLYWQGKDWFPAFMQGPAEAVVQLQLVAQTLDGLSPGSRMAFFTQQRGSLATPDGRPRTPLEALQDGDIDRVVRAAQACARG